MKSLVKNNFKISVRDQMVEVVIHSNLSWRQSCTQIELRFSLIINISDSGFKEVFTKGGPISLKWFESPMNLVPETMFRMETSRTIFLLG